MFSKGVQISRTEREAGDYAKRPPAGRVLTLPVILLALYLFVEYGRPAFLNPVRPALLMQAVFAILLIRNIGGLREAFNDRYHRLYMLLLVELAVHVPIAINNHWAYITLLPMLSYLLFSLAFCMFADTVAKIKAVLVWFSILMGLCAVDAIATGGEHIGGSGYLGDTNDFAMAMNIAAPVALYLGNSHSGARRLFFWGAAALMVMANMASFSRGGFIGLAAVAALCWGFSRSKGRSLAVIAALSIAFLLIATESYKAEILTIFTEGSSTGTGRDRMELWKAAWRAFIDNPFIGVGQGNIPIVIGSYQFGAGGESYWGKQLWLRSVHSVYFTVLPELGLIGVSIFALIIHNLYGKIKAVLALKSADDAPSKTDTEFLRSTAMGLGIGAVGYLVSGTFLSAFYYPMFWNLAAMITMVYMVAVKKADPGVAQASPWRSPAPRAGALSIKNGVNPGGLK